MDVRLIKDKSELNGTCYFEFAIGRYNGSHWRKSSVYLEDEVFHGLLPLFRRCLPQFDYYFHTQVNAAAWAPVVSELKELRERLVRVHKSIPSEKDALAPALDRDLCDFAPEYVQVITDLCDWLDDKAKRHTAVTILGM
jgi:hypothetical protein